MTLKQIFQLESILCIYLHEILKRLLAKVCFDASFMSLFRFVSFRVTFNDLCCLNAPLWFTAIVHLRVTDQSWQTGANKTVLHFEVVFVV